MDVFPFIPSSVLVWLIESTVFISILICLIFVVKAITGYRLPAWWHYGLWLLLVARMLIPGVFESRLSVFSLVRALGVNTGYVFDLTQSSLQDTVTTGDLDLTDEDADGRLGSVVRDHPWWDMSADQALLLSWLTGIVVFWMVVLVRNFRFWTLIRRKRPVEDGDILSLLEVCKQQMEVERDVSVVMTHGVTSPAVFGYLRPKLLLPEDVLDRIDTDQLHNIFLHELGHIKRHDIAVSCLMTVLQAIHWFNPLVWYAFYCMRADMEAACDAYVLSRIEHDKSANYANTIIGILEGFCRNRQLPALAGIIESRSQMKRRIKMVMHFRKHTSKMTFVALILFLPIGFVFFTGASGLSTEKDNTPSTPNIKHHVMIDATIISISTLENGKENETVISHPQIVTIVGEQARILVGEDGLLSVPGRKRISGHPFVKGLGMTVTAHVTEEGELILKGDISITRAMAAANLKNADGQAVVLSTEQFDFSLRFLDQSKPCEIEAAPTGSDEAFKIVLRAQVLRNSEDMKNVATAGMTDFTIVDRITDQIANHARE